MKALIRCLNTRASVPNSPTARASSSTTVSSSEALTWWFSWVTLTARITNRAEPVTQAEMATTVARLMLSPWSLALTMVVMTRAIAPIGWTTVSGAITRATEFSAMPDTQQQQTEHPAGVADQPEHAVVAERQSPGVRLDRTALALGAEREAERAQHSQQDGEPHHQRVPPSTSGLLPLSSLPLRMMAQK